MIQTQSKNVARGRQAEIDLILLFSLFPGGILLLLLLSDTPDILRVIFTVGFLSFYPGYLFARRIRVKGAVYKVLLSIGISFALVSIVVALAFLLDRWSPAYLTTCAILIVFTDVIFGKGSILSYFLPILDWSAFLTLVQDGVDSAWKFWEKRGSVQDQEQLATPNYLWQIEYVRVKSSALQKEVEALVISDLISQECLAAQIYRTGNANLLTQQLAWLFFKHKLPKYIEFHGFGEYDRDQCAIWLNQNYPRVVAVPQNKNFHAHMRYQLAEYIDQRISVRTDLDYQLDEWVNNYNQSLKITLPTKPVSLEAM